MEVQDSSAAADFRPPPAAADVRWPKSRHAFALATTHHTKACIAGFSQNEMFSSSGPALAQCVAGLQEFSARRAAACRLPASRVLRRQSPASCWVQLSFLGAPFKGSGQEFAADMQMGILTSDYNQKGVRRTIRTGCAFEFTQPPMVSSAGVIHIRLTLQHQVGNPDQCDENACICEGEPVDLFHRAPHDADSARRRLSMSFQDADNGRPSASAHNSRTFSSAINALNSCLNCTVEGI